MTSLKICTGVIILFVYHIVKIMTRFLFRPQILHQNERKDETLENRTTRSSVLVGKGTLFMPKVRT